MSDGNALLRFLVAIVILPTVKATTASSATTSGTTSGTTFVRTPWTFGTTSPNYPDSMSFLRDFNDQEAITLIAIGGGSMVVIATMVIGCVYVIKAIYKRELRREEKQMEADAASVIAANAANAQQIHRLSVSSVNLHPDCPYSNGSPRTPPSKPNFEPNFVEDNRKFRAAVPGTNAHPNDMHNINFKSAPCMPTGAAGFDALARANGNDTDTGDLDQTMRSADEANHMENEKLEFTLQRARSAPELSPVIRFRSKSAAPPRANYEPLRMHASYMPPARRGSGSAGHLRPRAITNVQRGHHDFEMRKMDPHGEYGPPPVRKTTAVSAPPGTTLSSLDSEHPVHGDGTMAASDVGTSTTTTTSLYSVRTAESPRSNSSVKLQRNASYVSPRREDEYAVRSAEEGPRSDNSLVKMQRNASYVAPRRDGDGQVTAGPVRMNVDDAVGDANPETPTSSEGHPGYELLRRESRRASYVSPIAAVDNGDSDTDGDFDYDRNRLGSTGHSDRLASTGHSVAEAAMHALSGHTVPSYASAPKPDMYHGSYVPPIGSQVGNSDDDSDYADTDSPMNGAPHVGVGGDIDVVVDDKSPSPTASRYSYI